jgi:hypothetical protein
VGVPEGRRPLAKPRRRWEDNIDMDLQEVVGGMDWIDLAQYRVRWWDFVIAIMNLSFPKNAGNFLTSFLRRALRLGVS